MASFELLREILPEHRKIHRITGFILNNLFWIAQMIYSIKTNLSDTQQQTDSRVELCLADISQ